MWNRMHYLEYLQCPRKIFHYLIHSIMLLSIVFIANGTLYRMVLTVLVLWIHFLCFLADMQVIVPMDNSLYIILSHNRNYWDWFSFGLNKNFSKLANAFIL